MFDREDNDAMKKLFSFLRFTVFDGDLTDLSNAQTAWGNWSQPAFSFAPTSADNEKKALGLLMLICQQAAALFTCSPTADR